MKIPTSKLVPICVAAVLLVQTYEAAAQVAAALATNATDFEKLYGYEPTESELERISRLRAEHAGDMSELGSWRDFEILLESEDRLLILVGHNEDGNFRFPSGETETLQRLASLVEDRNKIGIFLTCKGACFTNAPATRKSTNLNDALLLAMILKDRFFFVNNPSTGNTQSFASSQTSSGRASAASRMSPERCATLFGNISRARIDAGRAADAQRARDEILRDVRRTIFRFEHQGHISSRTAIAAATAGTAYFVDFDGRG